jgi:hypothetical protein
VIGNAISNDPTTGTEVLQCDDALDYALRLDPDLFKVYWGDENRREERFTEWLEKLDQRDIDRLARIAAVTRVVEKDRARVELEELIRRGVFRGR